MVINETPIQGAYIIEHEPFIDDRGIFTRIFCSEELQNTGLNKKIFQINHSLTIQKGALRGLHFQYPPMAEIKMVKCLRGSVFDVMVDLRSDSSTFLKWYGEILSPENRKMIYVPEGCAHGFQTLEEKSELLYLHTEKYDSEFEGGIRYDDPSLNISWPIEVTDISLRDQNHPLLSSEFKGIKLT